MRHATPIVGCLALTVFAAATTPLRAQILVYDNDSINGYALNAAEVIRPGEVVLGTAGDFNDLLGSQAWELVVMDFPNDGPDGGTTGLVGFVNAGGRAILSTWQGTYDDTLLDAFGADGAQDISLTDGAFVSSSGTAAAEAIFEGVPVPWFDWQDEWASDGAAFLIRPDTEGLAMISTLRSPVTILSNDGRTIATFLMDEWDGSTEAELVWENMMNLVLGASSECRADLDGDGDLTIFDFLEFQNLFDSGDLAADFDGDGSLTIFDFLAFQNAFDAGCE